MTDLQVTVSNLDPTVPSTGATHVITSPDTYADVHETLSIAAAQPTESKPDPETVIKDPPKVETAADADTLVKVGLIDSMPDTRDGNAPHVTTTGHLPACTAGSTHDMDEADV